MAAESNGAQDSPPSASPPSNEHATGDEGTKQNGEEQDTEDAAQESVFQLHIELPHEPFKTSVMCSTHEQVQDIRQSISELPFTLQYSCFHLEHQGRRINDFVELSEVPHVVEDPHAKLVEDPYTDSQARLHLVRVRELIGAVGDRTDLTHGVSSGLTLHDQVAHACPTGDAKNLDPAVTTYSIESAGSTKVLLEAAQPSTPRTIKSISLSPWNPPPYNLRAKGHLMYLTVVTNEGEQHNITSHVSGFYVNRCTNQKFDPFPRAGSHAAFAHSLLTLLGRISPSFEASFKSLQDYNGSKDAVSSFQITNAIPASPWIVSSEAVALSSHTSDLTRTQEQFLLAGPENAETLRDWNEEFQSTRELPKETVQERVFRERLTSKLFAEYNEAAVRGAVLVARGEVAPLNPTEGRNAQIFVYNNVFYSFGADGVGTFASDGGDEAARVATGKDVLGVRTVNQLDIQGLFTPGTVVVDYLGKRIVGQSIVPGIFKQRDPPENQIDYGGVEGKDVIAEHEDFKKPFEELSKALRVKKHPVWDKEGLRHDLEGSVETKGLLGTDGRKYALDLYRITPLDVEWLDQYRKPIEQPVDGETISDDDNYPHRLAVLRPELIERYWRTKLEDFVKVELARRKETKSTKSIDAPAIQTGSSPETMQHHSNGDDSNEKHDQGGEASRNDDVTAVTKEETGPERVDVSGFSFTLNPDVCSGQKPQTAAEQEELAKDEAEVRNVCRYLRSEVIPKTIHELREGDVGFPMDGASFSNLLHKRGINIRYLGVLATECDKTDSRLQALKRLCIQEMVARGFKHASAKYLNNVSMPLVHSCIAHLLNCLLGGKVNPEPVAQYDTSLKDLYTSDSLEWLEVTPSVLKANIVAEIKRRYRYELKDDLVLEGYEFQLLREISTKLGLQLLGRDYSFSARTTNGHMNGDTVNGTNGAHNKKSKTNGDHGLPASKLVFQPDDILNVVPVIKEASPRSALAEEALEAGRLSIAQGQKELGQELILESLSLHEQIYGILHPEVARVYYSLSTIYYSLDEKTAAVDLARKAVIISERTLGIDHAETLLCYLNLSLFEHAVGNTRLALTYILHALDIWKVIYGPGHPDSITTLNNAAVMLQSQKHYPESRRWFEASLAVSEVVSGKSSVNTATLLFQLAQALALERDHKAAVNRMREACNIFRAELGPEDRNTRESETWLAQLTQSAVNMAKHEKDLAARGIVLGSGTGAGLGTVQQQQQRLMQLRPAGANMAAGLAPASASAAVAAGTGTGAGPSSSVQSAVASGGGVDGRSIDELLKYINGGGNEGSSSRSKTAKKKKGHKSGSGAAGAAGPSVNPKSRQAVKV